MAGHDLIRPLLPLDRLSQPSDEPQLIINNGSSGFKSHNQSIRREFPDEQSNNQNHHSTNIYLEIENPFEFIASRGFSVSGSTSVDPFRNGTPRIEGVYEWLKFLVCFPIALVRLVLFGLGLPVGYVATKSALYGWKDKENAMPK